MRGVVQTYENNAPGGRRDSAPIQVSPINSIVKKLQERWGFIVAHPSMNQVVMQCPRRYSCVNVRWNVLRAQVLACRDRLGLCRRTGGFKKRPLVNGRARSVA